MLNHMEYLQQCFYTATGWNSDDTYDNILATSRNLLSFPIPRNFKMELASRSSEFTNSSISLTNTGILGGSLSYLSTTVPLHNVASSRAVPLQSMVAGYRLLENLGGANSAGTSAGASLFYGRIYFPSQFLEGMVIKRVSPNTQFILKCISTPKAGAVKGSGAMTFYWQNMTGKSSKEFIFSSSEALLGYRYLYNMGKTSGKRGKFFGNDGSSLSVGTEIWYGALSMSPGLSTALRYSTYSSPSGAPMTMTLSCNPLIGSLSSTYSVRTGINSTLCSKYDFNIYSSESDLSFGCELWRSSPRTQKDLGKRLTAPEFSKLNEEEQMQVLDEFLGIQQDKFGIPARRAVPFHAARKFVAQLRDANFTSVVKASTSVQTGKVNLVCSGKFRDFLVTTGLCVDLHDPASPLKSYGIQIQYAS